MPAVLFDLDGTLLDSVTDIGATTNEILGEFGLPTHPLAAYNDFVGEGVEVLMTRAMEPKPLDEQLIIRFRELYPQRMYHHTGPFPGVLAMLSALTRAGWKLGVLSNKPHEATTELVARLLGDVPWGAVAGQRQGWPRKPDPAAALDLCRQLGADPGACWFVGDTAVDMQTARAAGMRSVGVTWGFRPREVLDATRVAGTSLELQRILLGS